MSIEPTGDLAGALAAFRVQAGPQAGKEVPIRLPVATIGRANQNDVIVSDDSVSSTHARLEYVDGHWRLTDLDSKNGTYAEGVRLAPQVPTPLPFGTTVRLGGARLVFRPVEDADPETAREAYVEPPAEPTVRERHTGFRLPVWLLVLVIVLIALALLVFGWLTPDPTPTSPAPAVTPAAVTHHVPAGEPTTVFA